MHAGNFVGRRVAAKRRKSQEQTGKNQVDSLAIELLRLRDDLSAFNACNTFILQALTTAIAREDAMDNREATGAAFCAQWLDDRAAELEARLKNIHERITGATHHAAE